MIAKDKFEAVLERVEDKLTDTRGRLYPAYAGNGQRSLRGSLCAELTQRVFGSWDLQACLDQCSEVSGTADSLKNGRMPDRASG